MSRAKPKDLKEIFNTSKSHAELMPWLASAHIVINRYAQICTSAGEDTLKAMETFLAAHMISTTVERSKTATQIKMGTSSETYAIQGGKNLDSSPYGQHLKLLDPCGKLMDMFGTAAEFETL